MGWQPIETAPKDGTRVLLSDGRTVEMAYFNTWSVWWKGRWMVSECRSDGEEAIKATHWMPLPPPPGAAP